MTKYLKLLNLLLLVVILGCNSNGDRYKAAASENRSTCKPYFTYDQVEHYYVDISDDEVWRIEEKKEKTDKEIEQLELLIQHKPDTITDTAIVQNIEKIGFVKKELSKSEFGHLDRIFCERKHRESIVKFCVAIYRDLLVFKKDNKITGVAKICFGCDKSVITGTTKNTEQFGQSGDYEALYSLLYSQKPE